MASVHDDIAGGAELTAQEKRGHRILIFRRIVAYVVLILVCVIRHPGEENGKPPRSGASRPLSDVVRFRMGFPGSH